MHALPPVTAAPGKTTLGFVGMGILGVPMTHNLLKVGTACVRALGALSYQFCRPATKWWCSTGVPTSVPPSLRPVPR